MFKPSGLFFLIFLFSFFCLSGLNSTHKTNGDSIRKDSLTIFAKKHLGIKYHYANCTPKAGFDCSGFVYYVFAHFNVKVPRASMDYEKAGKIISIDSCRTGDIIVFTGTHPKNRAPGHVGIILSNTGKEIYFIHSSSGKKHGGVIITDFKSSPYYQSRFIKIARLNTVIY